MNKELKLDVADGIAVITLYRFEANNSLSSAIINRLGAAYHRGHEDDDIRIAGVTGAGQAFSLGADWP
jgi:enoyl-CoA hydratase/carnithine racemase